MRLWIDYFGQHFIYTRLNRVKWIKIWKNGGIKRECKWFSEKSHIKFQVGIQNSIWFQLKLYWYQFYLFACVKTSYSNWRRITKKNGKNCFFFCSNDEIFSIHFNQFTDENRLFSIDVILTYFFYNIEFQSIKFVKIVGKGRNILLKQGKKKYNIKLTDSWNPFQSFQKSFYRYQFIKSGNKILFFL